MKLESEMSRAAEKNRGTRRAGAVAGPSPLRRKPVLAAPASPLRRRAVQYLLVFVTVVLVVDALVGDRGVLERLRARKQYQELDQSIEMLKVENAQMRGEIRRLRDDPSAIESLAREELGLIRPGEVLFIIKDVKPASH
jgi:cell division protein FtsB